MADWKFGIKKIELPADRFELDEDGWIEVRTRITARDYEKASIEGAGQFAVLPEIVTGWSLKIEGQVLEFDAGHVLDLPIEILTEAMAPLAQRLGRSGGPTGSSGTTPS